MALPLWFLCHAERRSIIKRQEERATMHWQRHLLLKRKKHTTLNEQLIANGQMKNQIKTCNWLSKKQNNSNEY